MTRPILLFIATFLYLSAHPARSQQPDRQVDVWFSSETDAARSQWFQSDYPTPEYALSRQEELPLESGAAAEGSIIRIDPATRYQQIDGIGYSLEESTIYNLSLMSPAVREQLLRALVDPVDGIGLNMMRICLGTSDFTGRDFYSYDDPPDGKPDPELKYFSIQKDIDFRIVEIIKEARSYNPDLKLVATPWSPPAWMKTSGSMVGGSLKPEYNEVYARYLARAVAAYEAQGIPIFALTIQNEPLYVPPDYPGCRMEPDQARKLALLVHRELEERDLDTKILLYDHNYDEAYDYADAILRDEAAYEAVQGTAVHGYSGGIENLDRLHEKYPEKDIYFTERAYWRTEGMRTIAEILKHWSRSYLGWVTMLDDQLQPEQWTGTPSPTMVIQNSRDRDQYLLTPTFYMLGQYSKFVERDAYRIESSQERGDRNLTDIAFLNPDGTIVLVLVNEAKQEKVVGVNLGEYHFSTRIPGKTVSTYRIQP